MRPKFFIIKTIYLILTVQLLIILWKLTLLRFDDNPADILDTILGYKSIQLDNLLNEYDFHNFIEKSKKLYLNSKYLRILKLAEPDSDSKSCVDRATKRSIDIVLSDLDKINETDSAQIREFIDKNLHEPGVEIVPANFTDWTEYPKFVDTLNNQNLKEFSIEINRIWPSLYKKIDFDMICSDCVSSSLPLLHPIVVPGGRFIEIYYWDTYYTILGLLVSDMFDTVRQLLENFIFFINQFGFIPNGSRVYYLNRSQPPFFSHMVMVYYEHAMNAHSLSKEKKLDAERFVLNHALKFMIVEHHYWMKLKSVEFVFDTHVYKLNLYKANTNLPRPESYNEDLNTAKFARNEEEKSEIYMNIASAAESGYDFSTRWFNNKSEMHTIQTSDIIPADLNALMYKNELIIADLCLKKRDLKCYRRFKKYALKRSFAINKLLWSEKKKSWFDFNIKEKKLNEEFYVTNLAPLWFSIKPPNIEPNVFLTKFVDILLKFEGGIPVSLFNSTQQWDMPNSWAPYHHSIVNMLLDYDRDLALKISKNFFNSVYLGWKKTGLIYEKYNVLKPGSRGDGGEYYPQSGFGFTNGVVLYFINLFKDDIMQ
jgi:alpha,alpha-trehalase